VSARIAVFASGGGSNLQALLDSSVLAAAGQVVLVASDRADAGALRRVADRGLTSAHLEARGRAAAAVAAETIELLRYHRVDFIALAGYLRLVPAEVIREWEGRIVNIHPALLPAFGGHGMYGMNVHRAVIAAGCRVSGATVHFVNEKYDEGRIIAQWPVPVLSRDTPESLAARVLAVEHMLYPAAIAAVLASPGNTAEIVNAEMFRLAARPARDITEDMSGEMLRLAAD
jgi:phosphoribosylglycinamide formyltransferase 1